MVEITYAQMGRIAPLFAGQEDTLIRSCLQGYMGAAWADSEEAPRAAQIVVGDFCFFGGRPDRALAAHAPAARDKALLIVDPPDGWDALLREQWGARVTRELRYAFEKRAHFNRGALRGFVLRMPKGYRLERFSAQTCELALREPWSRDFVANFQSPEDFLARGRGFAAWQEEELVGAATSYAVYGEGIEVEVDVRPEHRRLGLATACSAALILDCLDAGLFPGWDAANPASVDLAKKLGYRYRGEYPSWAIAPPAKG